jgi:hypothetical protein
MIWITRTSTGLLLRRDAVEIAIDSPAVALALGPIIGELIDRGRAIGQARREGYEAGLIDGRERARIERETSERCAERRNADELAALLELDAATLAA